MNRREFLQFSALVPCTALLPSLVHANTSKNEVNLKHNAKHGRKNDRIVVLVELAGGNDGLNTLVPYTDPAYNTTIRPTLKLDKSQIIDIGDGMGMHSSLQPLKSLWDDEQLAWVQNVGYPKADLSHFRSKDIWETASSSDQQLTDGWLSMVLPEKKKGLHGIVMGDSLGPMIGKKCRAVAMNNPKTFVEQAALVQDIQYESDNGSLSHLITIQQQLTDAKELITKSSKVRYLDRYFHRHPFQNDLKSVAQMIVGGSNATVYKVTLKGFDTHANQAVTHKNQLKYLADGLKSFSSAMKASHKWDDVLVMTYSEFGRSVKENNSGGTDHGTAAPHLVMGGKVQGGELYGEKLNLKELYKGDLHYTTDFRSMYATVAEKWWGLESPWDQYDAISFV